MEYIVRVWSDEVSLAPIISGEGLELTKNYGSYVGVDCKDRSDVFMLSDVLSDVVIEYLQVAYLLKELDDLYILTDEEKAGILSDTLRRLLIPEDMHADISNRIAVCLMESDGGAVSLDGIMRFRMKDLTKKWSEELRKCCDEYIINTDGAELISMLKYIVSVREPLVGRVSVAPGESGYEIFSGAMRIGVVLIDEGEMSAEEALITRLIHLCPREIDMSKAKDPLLREMVYQIFGERTVFF